MMSHCWSNANAIISNCNEIPNLCPVHSTNIVGDASSSEWKPMCDVGGNDITKAKKNIARIMLLDIWWIYDHWRVRKWDCEASQWLSNWDFCTHFRDFHMIVNGSVKVYRMAKVICKVDKWCESVRVDCITKMFSLAKRALMIVLVVWTLRR